MYKTIVQLTPMAAVLFLCTAAIGCSSAPQTKDAPTDETAASTPEAEPASPATEESSSKSESDTEQNPQEELGTAEVLGADDDPEQGGLGLRGTGQGGGGVGFGGIGGHDEVDPTEVSGQVGARLELEDPVVGDTCELADVQSVLDDRTAALTYCYERELVTDSDRELRGEISVRWNIDGEGRPADAEIVETTMDHEQVEGCVVRIVQRMSFEQPEAAESCEVESTMAFSPEEPDGE